MTEIAARLPGWRTLSTDDAFVGPEPRLVTGLRHQVVEELLPELGTRYSADFLAGLLQTAVIHLKDQVERHDPQVPLLVDSYYYKILAKCRLAGVQDNPMYTWW